jgi:hypothetical protein
MPELFYTYFGKLVAIAVAECYTLLHEYSVLEPPGHIWATGGPDAAFYIF